MKNKCDYCGEDLAGERYFMLELVGGNPFCTTKKLGLDLCEACGTKVAEMLERGKEKKNEL